MFQVRTKSPLDGEWETRDKIIERAAGRRSDFAGTEGKFREHGWIVVEFRRAVRMKDKLNEIMDVEATVREHTTEELRHKR